MSFRIRTMLALPLLLASAACSDDSPTGPTDDPTQATLALTNTSNNIVLFVRSRACGTTAWGSDLLGSDVLGKQETMTRTMTPGCRDFRITPAEVGADNVILTGIELEAGHTKAVTVSTFPAE